MQEKESGAHAGCRNRAVEAGNEIHQPEVEHLDHPSLQHPAAAAAVGFAAFAYLYLSLPDVRPMRTANPRSTAFMELRAREADKAGGN